MRLRIRSDPNTKQGKKWQKRAAFLKYVYFVPFRRKVRVRPRLLSLDVTEIGPGFLPIGWDYWRPGFFSLPSFLLPDRVPYNIKGTRER